MKNRLTKILILTLAVMPWLSFFGASTASAALSNWQKGASIQSQWNGDFSSSGFKQSVDNLAATHANSVSLVFRIYQFNVNSTDIHAGGDTPTDQALADGIDYVHSKGLKVTVKPHLESYDGQWRANINPGDRNSWFTNYGNFMAHYAKIANDHGAEDFVVGTELINMASNSNGGNAQKWVDLINRLRGIFNGRLTYSANWGPGGWTDEKNNIDFWSSLDYIGIAAYYNLYSDNSVAGLKAAWDGYNKNDIGPLSSRWNKPVVFTEIGYRSVTNSHTQPWDYNFGGGYDSQEQANDYTALFDYWKDYDYMQGVQLWDWKSDPNAGGQGNTDYTPQHKPAQDTMALWFGQGGGGSAPPPGNSANFSATASANPSTVAAGQTTDVSAIVTANGGQGAGIIVDVEIYDGGGHRVKQQIFENQMFSSGQSRTYHTNFSPPSSGTYRVKIGVFNYNWSQLYIWNDNAATFGSSGGSSGGGTNPPPAPGGSIDIWWPSNGATVSGIQPFKALLTNSDVNLYDMYWQVDSGGLVLMPTDNTDYPHKQFDVDLSNWNWKGSGPYRITFVAKDKSGNVLGERSVDIYVQS